MADSGGPWASDADGVKVGPLRFASPGLELDAVAARGQDYGYAESGPLAGRRPLQGAPNIRTVQPRPSCIETTADAGANALDRQAAIVKAPPANPQGRTVDRSGSGFVDAELHPASSPGPGKNSDTKPNAVKA